MTRYFICDTETTGVDKFARPVELGIIVVDADFSTLEFAEWMIQYEEEPITAWLDSELAAFKVHGITPAEYNRRAKPCSEVRTNIRQLVFNHTIHGRKPILVSDNIVFEWRMLSHIMEGDMNGFHYCGWDTSLFLESTGVGDPRGVPHRALKDCGRLQRAIIEARDRTRGLRTKP